MQGEAGSFNGSQRLRGRGLNAYDIDFDPDKASKNLIKHGVSFDEAITVFYDSQALAFEDPDTEGEARWVLVGMSGAVRLLTVGALTVGAE
jgi:uncharacterized DUF497 family protein